MTITSNDRLKHLRLQLKLTQGEMAAKLEVKQPYYSDVENGRRNLTNKFIEKICNVFPVSKDWMYTGKGIMLITENEKKDAETLVGSITLKKEIEYVAVSELGIVLIDKLIEDTIQMLNFYCTYLFYKVHSVKTKHINAKSFEKYELDIVNYLKEIKGNSIYTPDYKSYDLDDKLKVLNVLNEKLRSCLDLYWEVTKLGEWQWDEERFEKQK